MYLGYFVFLIVKKKFIKNNDTTWKNAKLMNFRKYSKVIKNSPYNGGIASLKSKKYNSGVLVGSGVKKGIVFKPSSKFGKEKNIKAYLLPKAHALIFGATGSGKTDTILMPNILLNVCAKDKPSGLVFDPKGEIYNTLAPFCRKQGYKVVYINLSETSQSHRWNPFQFAIDNGKEFIKKALILNNLKDPKLFNEVNSLKVEAYNQAYNSVNETVRLLIEVSNGEEKSIWTENATALFRLACRGLFETLSNKAYKKVISMKEYNIKINNENYKEVLNLFNNDKRLDKIIDDVYSEFIISNVADVIMNTSKEDFGKFCLDIGWTESMGLFNATDQQYSSFQMSAQGALNTLVGPDMKDLVSSSDFSYNDLVKEKTMIFVNIPSTEETRKTIASLMVEQIYKFLEKYAKLNNGSLDRPFYFYLEELANCPKIQCFETILTLGRGMKIFGIAVIQSLEQLRKKYGQGFEKISWGNTMVKIYLLATEKETLDMISSSLGNKIIKTEDGQNKEVPLISTEDLRKIKIGTSLVMLNREDPIYIKNSSLTNYKYFWDWERKTFLDNELNNSILHKLKIKFNSNYRNKIKKSISITKKKYNEIYTPLLQEDYKKISYIQDYINQTKSIIYEKFWFLFLESLFKLNDLFSTDSQINLPLFKHLNNQIKNQNFENNLNIVKDKKMLSQKNSDIFESMKKTIINSFFDCRNSRQKNTLFDFNQIFNSYFEFLSKIKLKNEKKIFNYDEDEIDLMSVEIIQKLKDNEYDEYIKNIISKNNYYLLWFEHFNNESKDNAVINEIEKQSKYFENIIENINKFKDDMVNHKENNIIDEIIDLSYVDDNEEIIKYKVINNINNHNIEEKYSIDEFNKIKEWIVLGKTKWFLSNLTREKDFNYLKNNVNYLSDEFNEVFSSLELNSIDFEKLNVIKNEISNEYNSFTKIKYIQKIDKNIKSDIYLQNFYELDNLLSQKLVNVLNEIKKIN